MDESLNLGHCSLNLAWILKGPANLRYYYLKSSCQTFPSSFVGSWDCNFLLFSSLDNRNNRDLLFFFNPDLKKALRWILLTKLTTLPMNVFLSSSSQMSQTLHLWGPDLWARGHEAKLGLVASLFWATLQPGKLFLPLDNLWAVHWVPRGPYIFYATLSNFIGWPEVRGKGRSESAPRHEGRSLGCSSLGFRQVGAVAQ